MKLARKNSMRFTLTDKSRKTILRHVCILFEIKLQHIPIGEKLSKLHFSSAELNNHFALFVLFFRVCRMVSIGENNGKVKNIEWKIYSTFCSRTEREQRTTP